MITKYLITFPVGKAVAGYNTSGMLVFWELTPDVPTDVMEWLYAKNGMPCTEKACRERTQQTNGQMKVNKMVEDTSFDTFWNTYNHKIGDKKRAQKLWNVLNHVERVAVLMSLPKYDQWLSTRSIEKVYPETYLNQKRWENSFK